MLRKPNLSLSHWYSWEERRNYPKKDYPGVYVIAVTRKKLAKQKVRLRDINYIGMTNSKGGLTNRWTQFGYSINSNANDHSGGVTVRKEIGMCNSWPTRLKLFVAACGVKCEVEKRRRNPSDLIRMGWVSFMEYRLLSQYKKTTEGEEPKYNTK